MDLQRGQARILASGATGGPEDMLSPHSVRRIYMPLHPAGVSTGSTNAVRRTVTRDILQHALSKANINLDPLSYSPAGLCSLSPTPPPEPTPTVRPAGIGIPA